MSDDLFNSSDSIRSAQPLLYAQSVTFSEPVQLSRGRELPEVTVVYETYGTLNERKDNAILICHALSGDSHVASHDQNDDPGWWDILIGPGKYVDTNKYFVICPNVLGGCRGTTGPDSIDPRTGRPYGMSFPEITIEDIVEVQRKLVEEHLGISRLLAVVGGSLGGLMTLVWGTRFPDKVVACIAIATSAHLTSQALAFDIVARNAIVGDPHFCDGQYYDKGNLPATGLAIARMLGHITYLSLESMRKKFGENNNDVRQSHTSFETKFSVGSYLAHQGDKFVERFDANSYLVLSMAIDTCELGKTPAELSRTMRKSMCRWLLMSFSSDWLFPPFQSRELVDAAIDGDKRISYCEIKSDCGHDAFLLPNELDSYGRMICAFLKNSYIEATSHKGLRPRIDPADEEDASQRKTCRIDYERIVDLIPPRMKILDLGCGKGDLLAHLKEAGHERIVGIEIEERYILRCIENGLDVIHADLNDGLHSFYDKQFDFVILSKTLQSVRNVELVLDEMLRVGTRAIVSFPNLGWRKYLDELHENGRAPHTDPRPGRKWFNTNDVRFLTINDFHDFCKEKGYRIHRQVALDTENGLIVEDDPNLNADVAIVVLSKS